MTTAAKQERMAEQQHAVEYLRRVIDRETLIHTQTRFGSGMTDHVRVFVVRPEPVGDTIRWGILDVSYHVARAAGRRMTERGIAFGGGQYSKGLEAADDAWRAVFGEALPQGGNWRELPSL